MKVSCSPPRHSLLTARHDVSSWFKEKGQIRFSVHEDQGGRRGEEEGMEENEKRMGEGNFRTR